MQVKAIIETAIINDPTATPEEKERILNALKPTNQRPKVIPISSNEAAAMLGVHVVTLRRYEKEGKLKAIRYSPRKIRFDKNAVERLIAEGVV